MARRPADRKSQIRAAAADLFGQHGFHNVSVADVAGSVGITDAALYHHYRDKQDLLLHAVLDGLGTVDALIAQAGTLDGALRSLVALVTGPLQPLALWEREGRHLKGPRREPVREREAQLATGLVPLLQAARPELGTADAELIAWAVLGTLSSRARTPPGWSRPEFEELLYRIGSAAAYSRLPELGQSGTAAGAGTQRAGSAKGTRVGQRSQSRRDQLLTEAAVLFDERGFQSVTMAEIGAAAGIVASTIYCHFPGKTDLLVSAAGEAARRLRAAADHALAETGRPRAALGLLLDAHVALTIEDRHLIGILAHETAQLPEGERTMLLRRQARYLAAWIQVLGAVMPGREPAELAPIIEATHSMTYLVVRACHDELRPGLRGQLTGIGMTLLLSG